MKTKMLMTTLLIIILAGQSFAAGSDREIVSDDRFGIELKQITNSQTVRVTFKKPLDKKLRVALKDPEGNEIFRFFVDMKATTVNRNFNFDDADQGVYKLEISDRSTKIVKLINLHRVSMEQVTELIID